MRDNLITWENIKTFKKNRKLLIEMIYPNEVDKYEYEDDLVKFAIKGIARANFIREGAIISHLDKLYCFVYSFPTKFAEGFTNDEVGKLLYESPDINMEKFNNALMGNTCMLKEGETIKYHCDILTALRCGIENRDVHLWEWD